jgi:radical SAM superfamily enzyme YgiQ (UPF0313 family)
MGRNSQPTSGGIHSRRQFDQETGSIKKKWKNKLPVALIYPNRYNLGMSNLGFQLVYGLLNRNPSIVAERVFLPESGHKVLSIESNRPLADFPLLLFSISFEHDYLNLITLLAMAGISPLAAERTQKNHSIQPANQGGQPLVIAGGVATFINPEPLAPFVDLFIIGEAEPVLPQVMSQLISEADHLAKEDLLLKIVDQNPGCYVPEFYEVDYKDNGTVSSMAPKKEFASLPKKIKKVVMLSPGGLAGHSQILTPDAEFADLYMTELGRGCSRGCRFCAAGFVYRPPRLWSADTIIKSLENRPVISKRIGLLGMEMADSENLARIADFLRKETCSLSFSSLRADVISPSLLELLGKSGLKSVAIAPDGGSERLRRVINKGITENDVLSAAENLIKAGIKNLKLYFMIGLPTENFDDLEELVYLVLQVKKKMLALGRARGRLSNLTLSINCFIPKPWTPFQYHPVEPVSVWKQKLKFIRSKLAGEPNIKIKSENPEKAYFQAILARGDRRVGMALLTMVRNSCTWRQAFKMEKLNADDYALRERSGDELFPWEIIDHGIDRRYLWAEYHKAIEAKTTLPCDTSLCKRCGVC